MPLRHTDVSASALGLTILTALNWVAPAVDACTERADVPALTGVNLATDSGPASTAPAFAIVELPIEGGSTLTVRASNHVGEFTGAIAFEEPSYHFLPAIWDGFGNVRFLELPPGYSSAESWAVNDFGEAAGVRALHPSLFWESDGSAHQIPDLGDGPVSVNAMNNSGAVVGFLRLPGVTTSHAYVWSLDTGMIDLGDLDPDVEVTSVANDINDDGITVGYSEKAPPTRGRFPVRWVDGRIEELPPLPLGTAFYGMVGINNSGVMLGDGFPESGIGGRTVAVWPSASEDPIILLDRYPRTTVRPVAINNNNIIIADGDTNRSTALIWYDWEKYPVKLSDLLPWGSRWTLYASYSLNDHNQIGGLAFHNGRDTGFVATPVYPSIVMSEASPGIAGEKNTFQIANLRPNERVHLVAGKYGGGALIPGCSMLQNVLQIDHPKIVTTTTADALGNATIEGFVPAYLRGQTRVLQAVTPGTCEISNLVVQTFN